MGETTRPQTGQGEGYVLYEEEVIVIAAQVTPIEARAILIEAQAAPGETKAIPIPIEADATPSMKPTVAPLTVVGAFGEPQRTEQAIRALKDAGFAPEQVSMVARAEGGTIPAAGQDEAIRDAEIGAAGAGLLGGVAGWLLGISAAALPGIGPIVGVGVLWTTLIGAWIGAAAGGLGGALVGHGVDEAHAHQYEEHLRQGHDLVTVHPADRAQQQRAREILERAGGTDVRAYGEAAN